MKRLLLPLFFVSSTFSFGQNNSSKNDFEFIENKGWIITKFLNSTFSATFFDDFKSKESIKNWDLGTETGGSSNIENEMQTLPNASNHKEAVVLLDNMQRINNDLNLFKRVSADEEINLHRLMVLEARSLNLPVPILHEKNCRMDDVALRKILFKKPLLNFISCQSIRIEIH